MKTDAGKAPVGFRGTNTCDGAFSLVELLTATVVIGFLAGLLLVTLARTYWEPVGAQNLSYPLAAHKRPARGMNAAVNRCPVAPIVPARQVSEAWLPACRLVCKSDESTNGAATVSVICFGGGFDFPGVEFGCQQGLPCIPTYQGQDR